MSVTRTNSSNQTEQHEDTETVKQLLDRSTSKIAPLWSLESFVTVNPYHGMIDDGFGDVADRLESVAGARTTMPESFYLEALEEGRIEKSALQAVLSHRDDPPADDADAFIERVIDAGPDASNPDPDVPTVADVATDRTERDWTEIARQQVSDWAAAYFDDGQVIWDSTRRDRSVFRAWKTEAEIDRSPEILGLNGFRDVIGNLPDHPVEASQHALHALDVPRDGLDRYLHRLLMRVGGWSAYCARIEFEKGLEDEPDDTATQFLSVLLAWEYGLLNALPDDGLVPAWRDARAELGSSPEDAPKNERLEREQILLEAYEHTVQSELQAKLSAHSPSSDQDGQRPLVQSVFCIDVRSEVFRRHFEEAAGERVQTFGFPGFFGFPIDFSPLAHADEKRQCPPPVPSEYTIPEMIPDEQKHEEAVSKRTLKHQVKHAWQSFKWGAITCFSFVGPVGLAYLPKLFTDAFGLSRTVPHPDNESLDDSSSEQKAPTIDPDAHPEDGAGIPLSDRVDLAENTLNALSLTDGFARLVMITGHGATTVNNPYDSAYDCGACGGNAGNANARVAARVLNDEAVRAELAERDIEIPDDTFFLAGKHDTTTDRISILNRERVPATHKSELEQLEHWLEQATERTRAERAERFHLPSDGSVQEKVRHRSQDWSQVRPEWGLAGNSSFIVAPRQRTHGIDLEGRTFLHHYDWREDDEFDVLELIMTAPMVVTTWISLQYYASTVENDQFGSGNKTLHNVVGKMGVFEGNAGDLRTGLPWQSVHDGESYQHEPVRQSVIIEAPIEAMNTIIERHDTVRQLCDNNWLHLLAMDDDGTMTHRYTGNLNWREVSFPELD
jgi:uncharacterized protein YbcC (UPF0753/DUF2309 family)